MKHIVAGIVAHVDAGKTTLSEALLYRGGNLRQLGRVDNGDAFLDTNDLEKKRGITIFSHQANMKIGNLNLTLLDTPGHVDFASQTEQVLSVLDYAILVVSATDGIQGYTRTLWRLLKNYHVPTFIFVNKMDAVGADKKRVLKQLQMEFSPGCLEFQDSFSDDLFENIAMQDDTVLEKFLDSGSISSSDIVKMIKQRKIMPCYFGSALKLSGIDELISGLDKWTDENDYDDKFGARVFKISRDEKNERLTWVRVTGGVLHNKDFLLDDQKANQLRVYNGEKFQLIQEARAGDVCAISGLTSTRPGQGLGNETDARSPEIQPVLNYSLIPKENDLHTCLIALRELEDEDQQLHVSWSNQLQEISVQLMGEVQLEILQQIMHDRFNLDVSFGQGNILYKETITKPIEGVGHFEPLRHYAEVHLLLQPGPKGSGLVFDSDCSLEVLGSNWQHQVLTSLNAKQHLGVLTGFPLTDIKITLVSGKASIVHSVGGDFREATWRAVRQGLMMSKQRNECQLLEPWYKFRLTISSEQVGHAMSDIQRMHGDFQPPENIEGMTVLKGSVPVSEMRGYSKEVNSYTHGQGQLECFVDGYQPCHNDEEIIEKTNYDPVSDLDNTPGSVFCAHGAGYPVHWDDVPDMAHVPYMIKK